MSSAIDVIDDRQGVVPLSGEIDVLIPNYWELRPWKDIQIHLTWKPAGLDLILPDKPLVGVTPGYDPYKVFTVSTSENLGLGWVYSLYEIEVIPNPPEEWIAIKGDILVDELVIDTVCVPEPVTIALLGLGGLVVLHRRH